MWSEWSVLIASMPFQSCSTLFHPFRGTLDHLDPINAVLGHFRPIWVKKMGQKINFKCPHLERDPLTHCEVCNRPPNPSVRPRLTKKRKLNLFSPELFTRLPRPPSFACVSCRSCHSLGLLRGGLSKPVLDLSA